MSRGVTRQYLPPLILGRSGEILDRTTTGGDSYIAQTVVQELKFTAEAICVLDMH
ncbi:hypothetical protein J6590_021499 [Homalodisca vitripennis]|nr:hypothetical protein J6590_021499 [Homalodisca vitripennis]